MFRDFKTASSIKLDQIRVTYRPEQNEKTKGKNEYGTPQVSSKHPKKRREERAQQPELPQISLFALQTAIQSRLQYEQTERWFGE